MANSPIESLKQGTAPLGMRMAIAEGLLPLAGDELVTALGYLVVDKNEKVIRTLRENIVDMPRGFLVSTAQRNDCSLDLLHFLATALTDDEEVMQAIVLNRQVSNETLIQAAEFAPAPVLEILSQNRNRMLECPPILDKLLENSNLSRVTHFALKEFADRFQISSDGFDAQTGVMDADESVEETSESATATAVLDEQETPEAGISTEDLVQEPVMEVVPEIEEIPVLDMDEPVEVVTEDPIESDGVGVSPETEDVETDFSDGLEAVDFEQIKGFDSGWDIDDLVKEVAGDDIDPTGASDGFDDVLNIAVVDDDEEVQDDWLGDDLADVAGEFGFTGDDDDDDDENKGDDDELVDTRIRLMKMSAADKLILAQMGTKQERAILVTDPNKKVAIAVVEGPKMSEYEIVRIAANRQVYEEVLRAIAKNREWGRSNAIRRELVLNPKTPLSLTSRMLPSLNEYILRDIVRSKDLPSALVNQAKRVLTVREKRRGG